jgi:protein-disulfide isomerase
MNFKRILSAVLGLSLAALLTAIPGSAESKNTKDEAGFNANQKEEIQAIVKDYLIKNPEVIRDAIQELNKRHEAAALENRSKILSKLYKEDSPYSTGKGNITLIEFFDYNCGYCRLVFNDLIKLTEKEKDFRIIFMEYPTRSKDSLIASQIAVAAAKQNKYFEFHRAAMTVEGGVTEEKALKIAADIGLNMDKLKADMKLPEVQEIIQKNMQLGASLGVEGTPAFFIGDEVIPGAQENLEQMLVGFIEQIRQKGCRSC